MNNEDSGITRRTGELFRRREKGFRGGRKYLPRRTARIGTNYGFKILGGD